MAFRVTLGEPSVQYVVGVTATSTFAVPFPFDDAADLQVFVNDVLVLFSVTGGVIEDGFYSGATVVLAVAVTNSRVFVRRATRTEQDVLFPVSGPFRVTALNREISRSWLVMQELSSLLQSAVRYPSSEATSGLLPTIAARANKLVGFNSLGQLVPSEPTAGSLVVTPYALGILSSVSSVAARTVLGATTVGSAVFTAADAAAGRTALGATATGSAVLTAANAAAGLSALGGLPLTGGSITGGLTLSNDLTVNGSDIFIRGAANNNLWFQDTAGNERGVVWYDTATSAVNIRALGGTSVAVDVNGNLLASQLNSSWWFRNSASGGRMTMNTGNDLEFHWNAGFYYRIDGNTYVLINASSSDARYKEQVSSLTDGLGIVSALRPVRYTYKQGIPVAVPEGERVGFLLQEARQVMPSLGHEVGVPGEDADHKFLAYQQDDDKQLIAVLVRAVQQQQEQINALKAQVEALSAAA